VVRGVAAPFGLLVHGLTPLISRLHEETRRPVSLVVLVGREPVVIASTAGEPGAARLPLWATAAGKALLSTLPPRERLRILPPEPFPAFTGRTARNAATLFARMANEGRRGPFSDARESALGASWAAPVSCEAPAAAAAISIRSGRNDDALIRRCLARVIDGLS
jgi:IclR family acetate operon transcriptional repressor